MADKKKDEKKDENEVEVIEPGADEDSLLLPYERTAPRKTPVEDLFDLLGSDPEFQEDEEPEDADELESDEDDESGEPEDDEDDEDDDEEDLDDEEDEDEDPEEDEDDEEDEDEDEDPDEETLHEVTVQGETLKVTLEEALAGYSRTADYTRKRQADVDEHAKDLTEVRRVRAFYDTRLEQLEEAMVQLTPAAPDEKLRTENPGEYAAQKADQAERQGAIERVKEEKARVQRERDDETREARAAILEGQMGQLVVAVPEWANKAKLTKGIEDIRAFAQEAYGFSDEDLDGVIDHRVLLLLRENMQGRQKVKKGKKEIRRKSKKSRRMKPGGGERPTGKRQASRNKRKASQRARDRLAQSGSVQDAAAAIESLLGDDD